MAAIFVGLNVLRTKVNFKDNMICFSALLNVLVASKRHGGLLWYVILQSTIFLKLNSQKRASLYDLIKALKFMLDFRNISAISKRKAFQSQHNYRSDCHISWRKWLLSSQSSRFENLWLRSFDKWHFKYWFPNSIILLFSVHMALSLYLFPGLVIQMSLCNQ